MRMRERRTTKTYHGRAPITSLAPLLETEVVLVDELDDPSAATR